MSFSNLRIASTVFVAAFCLTTLAAAQQRATPPPPPPPPPAVPAAPTAPAPPPPPPQPAPDSTRRFGQGLNGMGWRVDIALSRFQGEKAVSRLPFHLVLSGDQRSSLRVGSDVPTGSMRSTTTQQGVTTAELVMTYIGTQIDASISAVNSDGRLSLWVNLDHRALASVPREVARPVVPGEVRVPDFAVRSFSATNSMIVREGIPSQFVVGSDSITGETVRAEVTVTTVK